MANEFKVPWERYGIIAYLAKAMVNINTQFGKTSLQKMIYFLQEIYGVRTDYKYVIYNTSKS